MHAHTRVNINAVINGILHFLTMTDCSVRRGSSYTIHPKQSVKIRHFYCKRENLRLYVSGQIRSTTKVAP